MTRKPGYSLIEVLVAVLLVALLSLGVLALLGGGLHSLLSSRSSGVCLQLCQEKMEALLAGPRSALQPGSGTCRGVYSAYQWTVAVDTSGATPKVTVTVHGRPGQSATLTAYARQSSGLLVFTRPDDKSDTVSQLWLCQADGSGLQQLTDDPSLNRSPTLSPDGQMVAFVSNRSGTFQVYVLKLETGTVTPVTHQPTGAFCPSWSGDGRLAYAAADDGYSNIFVTSPQGGNGQDVSRSTTSHETGPAWSADSTQLAWVSDRWGGMDLVVAGSDGGSQTRLTNTPGWNAAPAWNPDGSGRIAYLSTQSGQANICLVSSSGGPVTQVTHGTGDIEGNPSWSPSGDQLLFAGQPQGLSTFYIVNVDGTGLRPLWPKVTVASQDPSWVR